MFQIISMRNLAIWITKLFIRYFNPSGNGEGNQLNFLSSYFSVIILYNNKNTKHIKGVLMRDWSIKEEGAEEHVPGTECNFDKCLLAQSEGKDKKMRTGDSRR